jgi:ATP-dependent HslUV protease, peptidase subunit HslV
MTTRSRPAHASLPPRGPHGFRATTVCCVRRGDGVAMAGDGQVTVGQSVMKHGARKIRRMHEGRVLAGFAGSAADAFALFQRFEDKLGESRGNLSRAAVDLAKDWRMDRALRRLEALLVVADAKLTFLVSGTGDLIEPDDGIVAIGSGSTAALAAARGLLRHSALGAREIAEESLRIAASIDIYTNDQITVETLDGPG